MDANTTGNLSQRPVLSLLMDLHRQKATGSLRLERAPVQKAVYLKDGQILFAASNDPKDQLASILVEEGKLGPDQMAVAQARVSTGNPLAKVLTELGYISQRELADAARLKVEKILTDLYGWKEGSFQFAQGLLPKGAINLELSTPSLLFNSMRRIQDREWVLAQLGSLDLVLGFSSSFETFLAETKPESGPEEVLRRVDGVQTVKQIGTVSSLGEFEVCKILAAGLLLGALEKREAPLKSRPALESPVAPPPVQPAPVDLKTLFETAPVGKKVRSRPAPGPALDLSSKESKGSRPGMKPSADFLIEGRPGPQPGASPTGSRPTPKAPQGALARGGSSRKAWVPLLLVLLAGAVAATYYVRPSLFKRAPETTAKRTVPAPGVSSPLPGPIQPLGSPGTGSPGAAAAPVGGQTSAAGTPTQPSALPPATRDLAGGSPTAPASKPLTSSQPRPPLAEPPGESAKKGPVTAPPTQKAPAATEPTIPRPAVSPPRGQTTGGGRDLLARGDYPRAAAAFLQEIRAAGSGQFTLQLMLLCQSESIGNAVRLARGSSQLFIVPTTYSGRSCYRVCWGLFGSREAAEKEVASLPEAFLKQASRPGPIATSRLLH